MVLTNYKRGLQLKDPSPFYNPAEGKSKTFQQMMDLNRESLNQDYTEQVLPQYDWALKAAQKGAKISQINYNSALNAANNAFAQGQANQPPPAPTTPVPTTPTTAASPRLRAVLRALGAQESGNNWSAVNQDSGALGRWQVMPANIRGKNTGWDYRALGRDVTTNQYLNTPAIQRAIVRNMFGGMLKRNGVQGALSEWYSGDPNAWNNRDPQGNYPSVHDYVVQVLQRLGMWSPSGKPNTAV